MERVKGISMGEAGWIARMIYHSLKKRIGLVPKSKTLAAYDTSGLLATTWMDVVSAAAKSVPAHLKELAQLKVAVLAGCPF
ncbi:MAG TPA: hypothetical protein VMH81_14590 [Bryobacteraceae bacterium]|nr:hypothetical protein [Bryobacteraceae bacterium]HUI56187.1 hypothetical protein [Bryobacteraceae bacterium]